MTATDERVLDVLRIAASLPLALDGDCCGCCGQALEDPDRIFCLACLAPGHLRPDGAPWDRTYFAQTGHDCPYQGEPEDCLICNGEGYVYGDSLGDPLWYGEDESYPCSSCRGTGARKDMTWM